MKSSFRLLPCILTGTFLFFQLASTHAALLKTIEDLLGLPFMNQGQLPGATDLRSTLGI